MVSISLIRANCINTHCHVKHGTLLFLSMLHVSIKNVYHHILQIVSFYLSFLCLVENVFGCRFRSKHVALNDRVSRCVRQNFVDLRV